MANYGILEGHVYLSGDTEENLRKCMEYVKDEFKEDFEVEIFKFQENKLISGFTASAGNVGYYIEEVISSCGEFYKENPSLVNENIRVKLESLIVEEFNGIYEITEEYKWDTEEDFVEIYNNTESHAFNIVNLKKTDTYYMFDFYEIDLASFAEKAEEYVGSELGKRLKLIKPYREAHLKNQMPYESEEEFFEEEEDLYSGDFNVFYHNLIHVKAKCENPIILDKYLEYTRENLLYDNEENGVYEFTVIGDSYDNLKKLARLEVLEETVYPPIQVHEHADWIYKFTALSPKCNEGEEEIYTDHEERADHYTNKEWFEFKETYGTAKLNSWNYADIYRPEFVIPKAEREDDFSIFNTKINGQVNTKLEEAVEFLQKNLNDPNYSLDQAGEDYIMYLFDKNSLLTYFEESLLRSVLWKIENLEDPSQENNTLKKMLINSDYLKKVLEAYSSTEKFDIYFEFEHFSSLSEEIKIFETYSKKFPKFSYYDQQDLLKILDENDEYKNLWEFVFGEERDIENLEKEITKINLSLLERVSKEKLDEFTGNMSSKLVNFLAPNSSTIKIKLLNKNEFVDLDWITYQELLHGSLYGSWMKSLVVAINKK